MLFDYLPSAVDDLAVWIPEGQFGCKLSILLFWLLLVVAVDYFLLSVNEDGALEFWDFVSFFNGLKRGGADGSKAGAGAIKFW